MQQVVSAARDDARTARRDANATVTQDLRRLAGLAPAPVQSQASDSAAGGVYCQLLRQLGRWLLPAEVKAQTPAPRPPPPRVTFGVTAGENQRVDGARRRAAIYQVEINKKLAIASACFVFALIGVPLALRFPRGGAGLVIGTSVIVFAIYYVGLIGGEDLGDRLIVSPFLAMWAPNLLFGIVGTAGLWATRRASPAARGGGWSDLRDAIVGWLRRRRHA
jgi:hypothetical protein